MTNPTTPAPLFTMWPKINPSGVPQRAPAPTWIVAAAEACATRVVAINLNFFLRVTQYCEMLYELANSTPIGTSHRYGAISSFFKSTAKLGPNKIASTAIIAATASVKAIASAVIFAASRSSAGMGIAKSKRNDAATEQILSREAYIANTAKSDGEYKRVNIGNIATVNNCPSAVPPDKITTCFMR